MTVLQAVVAALLAFVVSLAITGWLSRAGLPMDVPNERSLHDSPTPRGGGIAILCGLAAGALVLFSPLAAMQGAGWVMAGCALLAGVSLVDDAWPLRARVRMGAHLVAALLVVVAGGLLPAEYAVMTLQVALPPIAGTAFAVLYIVWMANLFNFMDGMDGFAGGMASLGFGCFAVLGALDQAFAFTAWCALIAVSSAGFLVFNFPPARIFMGDVGSVPLGFLAAVCTLYAQSAGIFPFWIGVLVFSPFIVDATVTLLRRLAAGERVWQAHRSHYYQRLVRSGWGHRRTVLWEYALMAACAASALLAVWAARPALHLALSAFWLIGYTVLALVFRRA